MTNNFNLKSLGMSMFTIPLACSLLLLSGVVTMAKADVIWNPARVVLERQQIGQGVYALIPQGAAEANAKGYPVATLRYHSCSNINPSAKARPRPLVVARGRL